MGAGGPHARAGPRSIDAEADPVAVVRALADGDERGFADLVDSCSPAMLAVAAAFVRSRTVAEEVVQQAWLEVLRGLGRFEGRSSLRTWVIGITVNVARARARAERRAMPFSDAVPGADDGDAIDPARFEPADHPRAPHHWAIGPTPWPTPEQALLAGEARRVIVEAIAALPSAQRDVMALRDIAGCSADETCEMLGLTEGNQRVLLHRARTRVRLAIEGYFGATEPT